MVPESPNSPSPLEILSGNSTLTVLSVSPSQDDHDSLERRLNRRKLVGKRGQPE
jgi:hypothetical protein